MFGKKKPVTKSKNRLADILYAPDKEISGARGFDGVLAMLWRKILYDLQMNGEYFNQLLESFIRNHADRLMPRSDRSSLKGNLTKDFAKDKMSWRGIMKAILVLRVSGFDLIIKFRYKDKPGVQTVHSVSVDLSPYYDNEKVFDRIYTDERIETTANVLTRVEEQLNEAAQVLHRATQHSKEQ